MTTDESDTTRKIVDDLRKRRPSAELTTVQAKRKPSGKKQIFIAVGPTALRSLLAQNIDGFVVSAFTSSQAYRAIVEVAPERHPLLTAVYAEPSVAVQLRLVSMLYKKPVRVGAILSAKTAYLEPILGRAADQAKHQLTVANFSAGDNINRVLNRLTDVSVILMTPDSTVYNAQTLRNILLTSYSSEQATVGFSAALVKAGALASTFSEVEDIGAQVDEIIGEYETSGKVPEPAFPKYFRTAVNVDVARSLNIIVDDAAQGFANKPPQSGRKP